MLTQRNEHILRLIIEDYIQSAQPIGSHALVEEHDVGLSSATIRNEMAQLELEGYIRHPHTSAGRIPTEKGYQYYLRNMIESEVASSKHQPMKRVAVEENHVEETLKLLAQRLVELSGETAIVASDPRWSYYAGVSNLFHKPDFDDVEMVRSLSTLVDSFDRIAMNLAREAPIQPTVFIGSEGPFGNHVSAIIVRYQFPNNQVGLIGLIGPIRMNYVENIALMQRTHELLEEMYEG